MGQVRIPILAYHSIDKSSSVISTSPNKFQAQMKYLKHTSVHVVSLKDIVTCIKDNKRLPPKAVAITFDDGFQNFYSVAYPVLREYGFTATVFLVPEYCGKNNQWDGQPDGIPILDLLDWHEINELACNGIDFGAHTMTHPNLSDLPLGTAVREIVGSKILIQDHLEKEIFFFAYPYGELNGSFKRIVEDKFYGACSTELGFVKSNSDIYSLPRIDMYYFSKNDLFMWYGKSIFWLYILARGTLRLFSNMTFRR
jgi:peptidoglycan/xylan/chitin deacetylase (PgdA/CDA1 family)